MIILLNGSFGIGKTTVARRLRRRLRGSAIFDPELLGYALHRFPRSGPRISDYQDLPVWRRLTVAGVRATRCLHPIVVVPMTFSNLGYLQEVRGGLARFDPDVRHFCLTAPLPVVEARLRARGARASSPEGAWQFRRAAECCAAHSHPAFAVHIPTADLDPDQVADKIVGWLDRARAEP